jgi:heme A synthase
LVPWLADGPAEPGFDMKGSEITLLVVSLLGTLFLGMSGAITALGDTLFPASSLAEGLAQDFSPTAHFLLRLRIIHPTFAVLMACVLWLAAGVNAQRRGQPTVKRLAMVLATLVAVQLAAGLVNILLLAPIWMQLLHLLLADALWITLVLLAATAAMTPRKESAR